MKFDTPQPNSLFKVTLSLFVATILPNLAISLPPKNYVVMITEKTGRKITETVRDALTGRAQKKAETSTSISHRIKIFFQSLLSFSAPLYKLIQSRGIFSSTSNFFISFQFKLIFLLSCFPILILGHHVSGIFFPRFFILVIFFEEFRVIWGLKMYFASNSGLFEVNDFVFLTLLCWL